MMKRLSLIALHGAVLAFILCGIARTHVDWQASKTPVWNSTEDSREASEVRKAILEWLHAQPWAKGDSFELTHSSKVLRHFDRYGPNEDRPVLVMAVDCVRRLAAPHELSARPMPERFVFVLDERGDIIRRLPVDGRHQPYADLFGF